MAFLQESDIETADIHQKRNTSNIQKRFGQRRKQFCASLGL